MGCHVGIRWSHPLTLSSVRRLPRRLVWDMASIVVGKHRRRLVGNGADQSYAPRGSNHPDPRVADVLDRGTIGKPTMVWHGCEAFDSGTDNSQRIHRLDKL